MKKRNWFKIIMLGVVLATNGVMITSCSKSDSGTPGNNTPTLTPADFKLTIISHGQEAGNAYYSVEYTVKNISNKKYDINSTDDLVVKCAVKDNSGNTYTVAPLIPTLDPGATDANATTITLPAGVAANASTFTAAVAKE